MILLNIFLGIFSVGCLALATDLARAESVPFGYVLGMTIIGAAGLAGAVTL